MDIVYSSSRPSEGTLTVAQIAAMFGLSSQAVRLYHREGLLLPASVDENGYRRYSYNQIQTLATICYLRKLNQPIARIREYLQNEDVENSLEMLHRAMAEMRAHQTEIQRAIDVLEKKVKFVEKHLPKIGEKPEIQAFPLRFYVHLGSETAAAGNSAFFRYPTVVRYSALSGRYPVKKFGAFLDSAIPEDLAEIDRIEVIPKGEYLTAYLTGPYDTIHAKLGALRRQFPNLRLADEAYCINIIDQFMESNPEAYVVLAQMQVLEKLEKT